MKLGIGTNTNAQDLLSLFRWTDKPPSRIANFQRKKKSTLTINELLATQILLLVILVSRRRCDLNYRAAELK